MDALEKDDFEKTLPSEITNLAVRSGNELIFPLDEARSAVRIARHNLIAILGVEVLHFLDNGRLGVETYSGYEYTFDENWQDFVELNNDAASHFIEENVFGKGYGYTFTTTSENEFRQLRTEA
jgi:hypothetical protein